MTYKNCELLWAKRRGKDWKAVERDCRLTKDGDDFIIKYHGWYAGRGTGASVEEGLPLLRINPDDIATVLSSGEIEGCKQQITIPNRFTDILRMSVYRSAGTYKNREHCTRIGYNGKSHPFFVGLMINLRTRELVNPKVDVNIVVDRTLVAKVSKDLTQLKKLVTACSRMGSFDDITNELIQRRWRTAEYTDMRDVGDINVDNPDFEDARSTYYHGLYAMRMPGTSIWTDGRGWKEIDPTQYKQMVTATAVKKGLELVRRYKYDTTENAYVKVPAKPRGT